MVPRIKIQRPSTSSLPDEIVLWGTGNELIDTSLRDSSRHRHHDELAGRHQLHGPSLNERVLSWDDRAAFLGGEGRSGWEERKRWWKVYGMHFLFMWNSRTFEYVSIILIAIAFPRGLTATSVRGITSTVSSMLFSGAVGNWIDKSPSRLPSLLITISLNHAAIILSYMCWLYWSTIASDPASVSAGPFLSLSKGFVYGFILLLDIVHDLSAIANRLSVERDWIPTLIGPVTPLSTYDLTQVNAVFTRIEHLVKLVAPSLLPLLMATFSIRAGWIIVLIVVTILLWILEIWFARSIAAENPELRAPKAPPQDSGAMDDITNRKFGPRRSGWQAWPSTIYSVLYRDPAMRLKHYFSIRMWPASMSVSLLQLTVLAYSATLITYLLEVGFSLNLITVAKASGNITALASTFVTPMTVQYMRKRQARRELLGQGGDGNDDAGEGKIVRKVGMWGIASQFLCLIPVVFILTQITARDDTQASPSIPFRLPIMLFTALSLSRIGHITIQLMVQQLGQAEISATERSTFAGTEQSFNSLAELCHWGLTVVWSRPSQFHWLALGSVLTVGVSTVIYALWAILPVRRRGEQDYAGIAMGGIDGEEENGR